MSKPSKRQTLIREKVEAGRAYSMEDAVALLVELGQHVKFKESVDVAVNLGVDARKSDQVVRSSTVLPHGTGKTVRVAVFTQGANVEKAKEAGADIVGMDDLADEIKKASWILTWLLPVPMPCALWASWVRSWAPWPYAKPESRYRNPRRSHSGEKR